MTVCGGQVLSRCFYFTRSPGGPISRFFVAGGC